ncbi:uncharacterized protein K452DRAFT_103975 [Aplosporella prunicola CBS 121167]|uniref:Uncharacterized protein n=1 Tax=Aplosporella prunicola CBS 121167 TaxID=1176127 RepID=A0A6A6BP97_9PEZI|nr:uncharacterized protein K452DRAFT_103975 [Aplosporella prunicola CBS 121167]KAF2145959.1 hypothetical protein K452DRAFT_103975 [Aplosporella prunicola CBS 121167]
MLVESSRERERLIPALLLVLAVAVADAGADVNFQCLGAYQVATPSLGKEEEAVCCCLVRRLRCLSTYLCT